MLIARAARVREREVAEKNASQGGANWWFLVDLAAKFCVHTLDLRQMVTMVIQSGQEIFSFVQSSAARRISNQVTMVTTE